MWSLICSTLYNWCAWIFNALFGGFTNSFECFKNIPREWHEKSPKYGQVRVYQGRKQMFAIKTVKGKLIDVPCLIVNNRFVILDPKTKRRKYAIWKDD